MLFSDDLTAADIEAMIRHWLNTPVGAYLGSNYGNPIKHTLQRPMSDVREDEVLEKLLEDIPVLKALPSGTVQVYSYNDLKTVYTTHFVIEVGNISITATAS